MSQWPKRRYALRALQFFDDLALISPDEADHLHLTGALGTDQRVHFIHLFDQCRQPPPSLLCAGSRRPVLGGGWRGLTLAFRAQSPALVRVEAVVANQMTPRIGYGLHDRNVHVVTFPGFQGQAIFARKKRLRMDFGNALMQFKQNPKDGAIARFRIEQVMDFDCGFKMWNPPELYCYKQHDYHVSLLV